MTSLYLLVSAAQIEDNANYGCNRAMQRGSVAPEQTDSSQWLIYRLTVHLPAAKPTGDVEVSEDETEEESAGASR